MSIEIRRRDTNPELSFDHAIHPVLKRIYSSRNIKSSNELDYSLVNLISYQSLSGIENAVQLLIESIDKNHNILIVADFDADGATACAVAMKGLSWMGVKNIAYLVPNRFEYGYGLSPEIVEVAAEKNPDLIITVDNGISSVAGVHLARSKNIKVLITDHHLPPEQLPDATTIINPNLKDDQFPSKYLAGVGVMFYVLLALRAELRKMDWFKQQGINEPNLAELLDLVALGTIADMVPLDHNNRILVAQGLARIRAGKCCPGIKALFKVAKRSMYTLSAQDLGFSIAPRLNAAGRLTDMSLGIECLLATDEQHAQTLAKQLDKLNQERKLIQSDMQDQALNTLSELDLNEKDLPAGYCLFDENWHQGIVGILASRIKDQVNRPVIAFAREDDTLLKGSARSISGIHIRDVLDTIACRYPGIIEKFGGHAMAAGLTLEEKKFNDFQLAFQAVLEDLIFLENMDECVMTDGELSGNEFNMEVARVLLEAGPWGQGFPEPLFDGEFNLVDYRIVGEKHLKLKLKNSDNRIIEAIAFNKTDDEWPVNTNRIQTVYRLDINEFAGKRSLQLIIDDLFPLA